MYDTSASEDLNKLESEFNKLSQKFSSSINELKNNPSFMPIENKIKLDKSQMSIDVVKIDKMANYSDNTVKYSEITEKQEQETNEACNIITELLESLHQRHEFIQKDEELNSILHTLKKSNEHKANWINNKVKYITELVNRIKTDNDINMQINYNKRGTGNGFDDEYDI